MAALLLRQLVPDARAAEVSVGVAYDMTHTDNVFLSAAPKSDTINSARLGFSVIDNVPSLNLRASGQVEYRDYLHDSYDSTTLGALNAAAIWHIDPQRLDWTMEDYFGRVVTETGAANTQQNQQNVNVFDVGPNVYLHIDPLNTIEVAGRYANHYFQTTDTDNHRLLGEVRWIHLVTPRTDLSLNYQTLIVNYGLRTDANYVRSEVFARGRTRPGRSEYSLDLGTNFVTPNGRDMLVGALARLTMRRQVNERTSLQLQAATEYSDSDRDYVATAAGTGGTSTSFDIAAIAGVYYERRVAMTYTHNHNAGFDTANIYWRDIDYAFGNQDQTAAGGEIEVSFDTGPLITPSIFGNYVETRYNELDYTDRDSRYGARARYRIKRNGYIALEYARGRRHSSDITRDYEENRVMFSIGYLRNSTTSF